MYVDIVNFVGLWLVFFVICLFVGDDFVCYWLVLLVGKIFDVDKYWFVVCVWGDEVEVLFVFLVGDFVLVVYVLGGDICNG